MATTLQKLKDDGWYISDDGLKKLNENGLIGDVKELTKRALDYDLRELVTNGGLPNDIVKSSKVDLPAGGVVVQIINVRNVSAPKVNQESKTSPRLLQIDITDGQTLCSGLDLEHLSAFSINVAPGTKVLLRNTIKVIQGFLSLTPQNISILGGHVQTLYERWETNRTLAKFAAAGGGGGGSGSKKSNGETLKGSPPPWIPFGKGGMKGGTGDDAANFKSLTAMTKTKEVSKEESEFLAMRNATISDAMAKGEVRKHFGGSNRQLMDHNVKKIMDKGYSEDAAKLALKAARNNLERAMSGLKRSGNNNNNEMASFDKRHNKTASSLGGGGGASDSRRGGGGGGDHLPPAKPSGKVSLFDFLSDKIPDVEPLSHQKSTNPTRLPEYSSGGGGSGGGNRASGVSNTQGRNATSSSSSSSKFENNTRFENNVSSSFASRQKKEDSYGGGGSRNKWNDNNGPDKSSKTTSTFQQYQGSQSSHQQQQQQQQPSSYKSSHSNNHGYHASNNSNNYHQNNAKNSRYQNQSTANPPATNSHQQQQQQHQYSDMVTNKRLPPNDRKTMPNSSAPLNTTKPKPNNNNANMKSLIDSTANLQISNDSKHRQQQTHQQTHHPSQMSSQQQQPQHKPNQGQMSQQQQQQQSQPQLSSGNQQQQRNANFEEIQFPIKYNPYKIMGFQNKETNEFALNVLKMGDQKLSNAAAGGGAANAPNNNLYVNNSLNNVANIPNSQAKHGQVRSAQPVPQPQQQQQQQPPLPPQQQQIPQIVSVQAPKHANYMPNPTGPPPHTAYALQSAPQQQMPQPPPSLLWAFNVGDRCLAKYWEDEKYYNAEIQAVTDRTLVVHFLEYGNVEEVLRSDCLPITDANHQPINHGFSGLAPAPAPTLHPIAYTALPPNKGGPPLPPPPTHFHQPYHSQPGHHPPPQPPPQHHHHHHHPHSAVMHPAAIQAQQNQQPQRYRGNRQVYVPPAQRK